MDDSIESLVNSPKWQATAVLVLDELRAIEPYIIFFHDRIHNLPYMFEQYDSLLPNFKNIPSNICAEKYAQWDNVTYLARMIYARFGNPKLPRVEDLLELSHRAKYLEELTRQLWKDTDAEVAIITTFGSLAGADAFDTLKQRQAELKNASTDFNEQHTALGNLWGFLQRLDVHDPNDVQVGE